MEALKWDRQLLNRALQCGAAVEQVVCPRLRRPCCCALRSLPPAVWLTLG
jgi:hypothetical protein